MDESQWLEGLRRQAENHTKTPPQDWWGEVERRARLAAAAKWRRRVFAWVGSSAAAAVAVIVVFLGSNGLLNAPGDNTAPTIVADVMSTTEPEPLQEPIAISKPTIIAPPKLRPAVEHKPTAVPEPEQIAEPTPEPEPTTPPQPEPRQPDKPSTETKPSTAPQTPFVSDPFVPKSKPHRKRWQAGLYASNMSSSNSQNSNLILWPGHKPPTEPEYTDITHRLPLTVGLTVSRGIGGRWSLATGLNYTMLSSRFRTDGNTDYLTREQVLHNIGIPLSINYSLWQGRNLSIYLSAGGTVEKSVSGTATLRNIVGGATKTERRDKISDKFQWALRGAAGLQYDFSRTMGVYAEPGVNYYFDNRSGIETIYKTKPLNFGLQLGFRFSM